MDFFFLNSILFLLICKLDMEIKTNMFQGYTITKLKKLKLIDNFILWYKTSLQSFSYRRFNDRRIRYIMEWTSFQWIGMHSRKFSAYHKTRFYDVTKRLSSNIKRWFDWNKIRIILKWKQQSKEVCTAVPPLLGPQQFLWRLHINCSRWMNRWSKN